jgi:lipoprotein signal peptidase
MTALAAGLLIVPLVDQGLKAILRRTLGLRSFSLGWFGSLRVKEAQIWWVRLGRNSNMAMIWLLWLIAAGAVATLTVLCPSCGWFASLLVGGSISHGLESSIRGCVSDYVCLRFWPAFNIADVAITVGAIGLAADMVTVITNAVA